MHYSIKHIFNTDPDTYWDKIFFDDEFNEALFKGHLGFFTYAVLSFEGGDDVARPERCTDHEQAGFAGRVGKTIDVANQLALTTNATH